MSDENQAWLNFFVSGQINDYMKYCESKKKPQEEPEDEHQDQGDSPKPKEFPFPGKIPYTTDGWPWLT